MAELVGRNDLCPCGSGKKYKKCCLSKAENPIKRFYSERFKELKNACKIKQCLFPDHSSCSSNIIKAHSIQNNRILSKIAENGKVLMPKLKSGFIPSDLTEYGRNEATTFTGFCGAHDKSLFQPIEDRDFICSIEQIFFFTYRAFSAVFHGKCESSKLIDYFINKYPEKHLTYEDTGDWNQAIIDLLPEKKLFDDSLLQKKFDNITSIVWEFSNFSHFAASGMDTPKYDFNGNLIQELNNKDYLPGHIFYYVFPQNNKTFAIIAWQKKFDLLFSNIKEKLLSLSYEERKKYLSNILPKITENIVIKPSSWYSLPKAQQENFLFLCSADMLLPDEPIYCLEQPPFDLFSL